ncbi:MAG: hypothetical protein JWO67_1062 [Streptosporangiaceae bacterium]|nr:hypothetical protein [Streptosporangiaceae bacterium]
MPEPQETAPEVPAVLTDLARMKAEVEARVLAAFRLAAAAIREALAATEGGRL